MPDLDERVIRLEERSDAQGRTMDHLRTEISDLRHSVDSLSTGLRADMRDLRQEMAALRDSVDRRFTWLVGIQVAGLIAVVAALVGAYYRP